MIKVQKVRYSKSVSLQNRLYLPPFVLITDFLLSDKSSVSRCRKENRVLSD